MSLKYSMIQGATITLQECSDKYNSDYITLGVLLLIMVLIFGGLLVFISIQHTNLSRFIKDEKLQEKYQKYRKDNKGL